MTATLLMSLFTLVVPPEARALFEQANAAYSEGRYEDAIEGYSQLNDQYHVNSPALLYNLGVAHHRLGHLGNAVLHYEAALAVDPELEAARKNLVKALGDTKRSLPIPDPQQAGTGLMVRYYPLSPVQSVYLAHFFILLACAAAVVRYFRRHQRYTWMVAIFLVLAGMIYGCAFAANAALRSAPRLAVALEQEVPVYFSTSTTEQPRFVLYEGDRVLVDRFENDWIRVNAYGGERGWAKKESLGIVDYRIW